MRDLSPRKKHNYLFSLVATLMVLLTLGAPSLADNKEMTVGYYHYPPDLSVECCKNPKIKKLIVSDTAADMALSGPFRFIVEELLRRANIKTKWKYGPFSENIVALKTGEIDALPLAYFSKKRSKFSWFVGPVEMEEHPLRFIARTKIASEITKYDDLLLYKLANICNTVTNKDIEADKRLKLTCYDTEEAALNSLISNESEIVLQQNLDTIENWLIKNKNYAMSDFTLRTDPRIYILLSKKTVAQEIAINIDSELEKMFKDGTMRKVFRGFHREPPRYVREDSLLRPAVEKNLEASRQED